VARKSRDLYEEAKSEDAPFMFCWLCARPMGEIIEWHHPIPKSRGGRERRQIHPICHQTIHANFTNSDLEKRYSTVDALLSHPEIRKFVDWIANKPPNFHAPTRERQ
jgi:hypothetical protein